MNPLILRLFYWAAVVAIACRSQAFGAVDATPFPETPNKKGLQVQMVDDAIALGIHHAGLNCDLGQFPALAPRPQDPRWENGGRTFAFRAEAVEAMDRQIEPLSRAGVVVYLILICREPADAAVADLLLHPRYDRKAAPNRITAFNTGTEEGRAWLRAMSEFFAARYSGEGGGHGRVWGYIVGNEVNSHWWWYNLGRAPLEDVAQEYEAAVRIVHTAVRTASAEARIYLSFDHHWTIRYAAGGPDQGVAGRALLDAFAQRAREGGDFDWHVAYHPYPEDLTNPRFWNDRTALPMAETPRITFKNLGVLTDYLQRSELLWKGKPRRVILSEQGFNCADTRSEGEREQAAAFAYAWKLVARNRGIDAFILHRHVDHAQEGLNLGLWTHAPETVCTPGRKRLMYEVFRAAGTPEEEAAFAFALPIVGLGAW